MSKGLKIFLAVAAVLLIFVVVMYVSLTGAYNSLVDLDENVKGAWSQVQNVYQRRADLIPNLVETVRGYAQHEKETLESVVRARASATRPEINAGDVFANPQLFQQFEKAQAQLSSALSNFMSRLLVTIERYPDLKANANFIRLQDELAGSENRIAVERRRFNTTVQTYNKKVRSFPTVLIAGMFGFSQRPYFEANPDAQEAPKVDFSGAGN